MDLIQYVSETFLNTEEVKGEESNNLLHWRLGSQL